MFCMHDLVGTMQEGYQTAFLNHQWRAPGHGDMNGEMHGLTVRGCCTVGARLQHPVRAVRVVARGRGKAHAARGDAQPGGHLQGHARQAGKNARAGGGGGALQEGEWRGCHQWLQALRAGCQARWHGQAGLRHQCVRTVGAKPQVDFEALAAEQVKFTFCCWRMSFAEGIRAVGQRSFEPATASRRDACNCSTAWWDAIPQSLAAIIGRQDLLATTIFGLAG